MNFEQPKLKPFPHVDSYRIKPKLWEKFKTHNINSIIQDIIAQQLDGKSFNASQAGKWSCEIADAINVAIKENVFMSRYKHVVNVLLAQQTGAGCRYIAKCSWDADSDAYVSYTFRNDSLFCVCTVFGVYLY